VKPNEAIPLGSVHLCLRLKGKVHEVAATPSLRLLPTPRLIIDFSGPSTLVASLSELPNSVKLLPHNVNLKVIPIKQNFNLDGAKGQFTPTYEPVTVRRERRRLKSVTFSLINFPDFFGIQGKIVKNKKGGIQSVGEVQLVADQWKIVITAVPEISEITKELRVSGGFAITHTVRITNECSSFSSTEAEVLLEALRLFLSFARGAYCSPVLQKGFDKNGDTSWEQWGVNAVSPWRYRPSWFDSRNGHFLMEVFPGFWKKINDPMWSETVRNALYWYLRSNGHGEGAGVDGGLILTQAALERLSYVQLGKAKANKPASNLIRRGLTSMDIGTNIPRECAIIRKLARENNWEDAPHAITAIRNGLVHPKDKHGTFPSSSYYEAWNIGQHLIELMLLRLFNHNGRYANRISQKWAGEVVRVPWA